MNILHQYTNGNVHVTLYEDGTKERNYTGVANPIYPESIDVKITNYCDAGCAYCHEKSTKAGQHGDLGVLFNTLKQLPSGTEIACLHGSSVVYNQYGAIEIKDLNVGDKIYDSNNELKTITSIIKTNKESIKLNGSKGFEIICSKDHPFMVDGIEVQAQYLLNKKIDLFKSVGQQKQYIKDIVGVGSRNKNLFSINDTEYIRSALFGLFQGDSCFRVRKNDHGINHSLSYKTVSKKLAYDIIFLLKKYFDVSASIYYGISPERKIDGRTLASSDYYKIDIYGNVNIKKLFPDYFKTIEGDCKQVQKPTDSVKIKSIIDYGKQDLYDITLEDSSSHIFPVNGYILTHNCGGGNPLSHPDLLSFLGKLKEHGIVTNITINQKHVGIYRDLILKLISEKLVYGVGISYSDKKYLDDIAGILKATDNVVFHTIMGINPVTDIDVLKDFCSENNAPCKILVLGYKQFGFGIKYYIKNKEIEHNKYGWYTHLAKHFKTNVTLSFDNLAITQLNLKRYFTGEAWKSFYMGDDFVFTMYIDGVNQTYAPTSTSEDRVSFSEMSLVDFFKRRNV
jgi:hypothetical protein